MDNEIITKRTFLNHANYPLHVELALKSGSMGTFTKLVGRHYVIIGAIDAQKIENCSTTGLLMLRVQFERSLRIQYPAYGLYIVQIELAGGLYWGILAFYQKNDTSALISASQYINNIDKLQQYQDSHDNLEVTVLKLYLLEIKEKSSVIHDNNKEVSIYFRQFLRPEVVFSSFQQFEDQMHFDVSRARYSIDNVEFW